MITPSHLRILIIRSTLQDVDLWSPSAEQLLMGTAMQESRMGTYLRQINGPALGIFQMEPATYKSIHDNYLKYRPRLVKQIEPFMTHHEYLGHLSLIWNFAYATIMARIQYFKQPEALPAVDDDAGLAAYWKKYYNTPLGRGTEEEFIHNLQVMKSLE